MMSHWRDLPYTLASLCFLTLASAAFAAGDAVDLNQNGLTGSWYDPQTSGQGFEVEAYPDLLSPGTGLAFVTWFTYDSMVGGPERQRWYSLSGPVVSGQPNASLTIYQNTGGNFNAPPITESIPVGTATLGFDSCISGQLSYTFTDGSGRSGSIPLQRLTPNVTCSVTGEFPENVDFMLSGNWYDPATAGQGISVEVNPISNVLFFAWETYASNGANAGPAGQRWYTGQGTFAGGYSTISVAVQLYESTGGVFNKLPPTPSTVAVGSATLVFTSCWTATLSYSFAGGTSSGASGTIKLGRDFVPYGGAGCPLD
jgi:pseudomonalisin